MSLCFKGYSMSSIRVVCRCRNARGCTGNHKQNQNIHKNSRNNDSKCADRFELLFFFIHIITYVVSAAESLSCLRSLSPTALPSLNTLNAGKPLCNSSCFHSSVNILSEEVGAARSAPRLLLWQAVTALGLQLLSPHFTDAFVQFTGMSAS